MRTLKLAQQDLGKTRLSLTTASVLMIDVIFYVAMYRQQYFMEKRHGR